MSAPPGAEPRRLLYVPIVHTAEDLGSFAGEAQRRLARAMSPAELARRSATIVAFWHVLRDQVTALPFAWDRTRIYQDGLPVCGQELAIVKELAQKGNLNHSLLLMLVERGATLMGTEDPALLIREYRRIQALARAGATGAALDPKVIRREGEELLRDRDLFIANRIDQTLQAGESGVLFIGLLHRVDALLQGKIEIQSFRDKLPPGITPLRQESRT